MRPLSLGIEARPNESYNSLVVSMRRFQPFAERFAFSVPSFAEGSILVLNSLLFGALSKRITFSEIPLSKRALRVPSITVLPNKTLRDRWLFSIDLLPKEEIKKTIVIVRKARETTRVNFVSAVFHKHCISRILLTLYLVLSQKSLHLPNCVFLHSCGTKCGGVLDKVPY